jgi:hypothetical protein
MCLLASWIKRYHLDNNKIWKQIIDYKYRVDEPNLFYCPTTGASPFWKGVMWAAKAARIGFQWQVGNGRKIKFWEGQWFGTSSLAIQYWDVYILAHEQNLSIAEAWDGTQLRISFRRCFDHDLMVKWFEIVQIAQTLSQNDKQDTLIWMIEANGLFSVKSMYVIINFRGVTPVNIHSVWKIKVPPKIHFFLWLIAHNKLLTRDNLSKRQHVDDLTCLFCNEEETCNHLFYDCVVVSAAWAEVKRITKISTDFHYFSDVADLWNYDKKIKLVNMMHVALLRVIWLMRNDICFNRVKWSGMQILWRKMAWLLAQWEVLLPVEEKEKLQRMVNLEVLARAPPMLLWPEPG